MKKNNIEQPVTEPVEIDPPSPGASNTPVSFNFTDEAAQEEDMNPVRDILSAGQAESEEMMGSELVLLTVEEVAAFLKGTYDAQGWFTYPEMWKRDPSFFTEIAIGILPQINAWAARVPAVAHAIKTVSAAGSWGRLIWDMAGTWVLIVRRRQLEAQKMKEEQEKNQNAGYQINYSNSQPQPVNNTNKQGFIIP